MNALLNEGFVLDHLLMSQRIWSGCLSTIVGGCEECAVRSLAALIEMSKQIRDAKGLAEELITKTLPPVNALNPKHPKP